jgi:hypothetical protein
MERLKVVNFSKWTASKNALKLAHIDSLGAHYERKLGEPIVEKVMGPVTRSIDRATGSVMKYLGPTKDLRRAGKIKLAGVKRDLFLKDALKTQEKLSKTRAYTVGGPGISGKDLKKVVKLARIEKRFGF